MKGDRLKSGINVSEKSTNPQEAAWNSSRKKEQQVKMSWRTTAHYFPNTSLLSHEDTPQLMWKQYRSK